MYVIDSEDESEDEPMSTEILEDIFTVVNIIRALIVEKHIIKYVTALNKDNDNGNEC